MGVSKAFAIDWWCRDQQLSADEVVFSGDSGNDYAALTAGYRSVLVGNASRDLASRVQLAHQENGWPDRLCLASQHATSGVLEGLRHFSA
jgi:hydroxymethylpyrimidine pyrophosphatase-like HAD family hydrolase